MAGIGGAVLLSEGLSPSVFWETNAPVSGGLKELKFTAAVTPVTLGGEKPFKAWTYNGQIKGAPYSGQGGGNPETLAFF